MQVYVDGMLITWLSAVCAMNEAECVLIAGSC